MRGGVLILAPLEEGKIRLRLGISVESERQLSGYDEAIRCCKQQDPGKPPDDRCVRDSLGCHIDDLALDQLDARIGRQQTELRHPVVFLDGDAVAADEILRHGCSHEWLLDRTSLSQTALGPNRAQPRSPRQLAPPLLGDTWDLPARLYRNAGGRRRGPAAHFSRSARWRCRCVRG